MRWSWLAGWGLLLAVGCAPPAAPEAGPGRVSSDWPRQAPTTAVSGSARSFALGLAVPDARVEPWLSMVHGARDEAAQRGVELALPVTVGATAAERQAEQLRELIRRRVDFVLIGGGDDPAVVAAVTEANASHMPLAGLSSELSPERLVFKVGPDRFGMGRMQADCLAAALGGRGGVALLTGPPSGSAVLEQARGFKETLQRQYPGLQLLAERAVAVDRAAAGRLVGEWLERWPELAGLAADAEEPALGALDTLSAFGRLGETRVAAAALGPLGEHSLRDGGIQCEAVEQSVEEGRAAVRNALAHLANQPFERNIKSPAVLVTRDNFETVDWGLVRAPVGGRRRG